MSSTPYAQLGHFPRYLKAMKLRIAKRRQNPARDEERARELAPFVEAARKRGGELRWLVEEYRVSLFAQELGTATPVSKVKLEKALGAMGSPLGGGEREKKALSPAAHTPARTVDRTPKLKSLRSLDSLFPRPGG